MREWLKELIEKSRLFAKQRINQYQTRWRNKIYFLFD